MVGNPSSEAVSSAIPTSSIVWCASTEAYRDVTEVVEGAGANLDAIMLPKVQTAEQVVALCFGDPSCVPEHRLAETIAEIAARGRQEWARDAANRTAVSMLAGWFRGRHPRAAPDRHYQRWEWC